MHSEIVKKLSDIAIGRDVSLIVSCTNFSARGKLFSKEQPGNNPLSLMTSITVSARDSVIFLKDCQVVYNDGSTEQLDNLVINSSDINAISIADQ